MKIYSVTALILLTLFQVGCGALTLTRSVDSNGNTNQLYSLSTNAITALQTARDVSNVIPFPYGSIASALVTATGAVLAAIAAAKSHQSNAQSVSNGGKLDSVVKSLNGGVK